MNTIKVFAPATVSNIGCGFDVLGFALFEYGDTITVAKNELNKIRFTKIESPVELPYEPERNVAGVAVRAMLSALKSNQGFDIEIVKGIKPGSGIGSSAASSAGAVVAVNELLGKPFSRKELIPFAMEGEKLISGSAHADNVAPCILGGITIIRGYDPLDVIKIEGLEELYTVLIHPQIEIKTKDARDILKPEITLKTAVNQWGNLAGLVASFFLKDYDLMANSIQDFIIEPQRKALIQGYDKLKEAAMKSGALGCNISGSGPSVFALAKGEEAAESVKKAMEQQYKTEGIDFYIFISKVNDFGTQVI